MRTHHQSNDLCGFGPCPKYLRVVILLVLVWQRWRSRQWVCVVNPNHKLECGGIHIARSSLTFRADSILTLQNAVDQRGKIKNRMTTMLLLILRDWYLSNILFMRTAFYIFSVRGMKYNFIAWKSVNKNLKLSTVLRKIILRDTFAIVEFMNTCRIRQKLGLFWKSRNRWIRCTADRQKYFRQN